MIDGVVCYSCFRDDVIGQTRSTEWILT